MKVVIIGAGPTGIGAALELQNLGHTDFLIIEKESYPGGLATTFKDEKGFYWDIGGHVQFSHYPYFDKYMEMALGHDGWNTMQRESWVWIENRFVPYPFQNNIHRLSDKSFKECLSGLKNNNYTKNDNFKDWLRKGFGDGICKHFLYPYNYKVWAYHPEKLNSVWVGERVSQIDLARIEENARLNRDDVSWGPNHTFNFPKKGGTGAIWKSLFDKVNTKNIKLNEEIISIDSKNKMIKTSKGEYQYDVLLNTMPLDIFCNKLDNIDNGIKIESSKLKHSTSHIVGIGYQGELPENLKTKCWMYFPEDTSPFYRVTVFSNYSQYNVPDSKTQFSMMCEISESSDKNVSVDTLIQDTIKGLENTILKNTNSKIVSTWQYSANYGYPTPSLERDQILNQVIPYLDKKSLYSRGRFGGWKYEVSNQDHSFMQGVEWVRFVLDGKTEETYKL